MENRLEVFLGPFVEHTGAPFSCVSKGANNVAPKQVDRRDELPSLDDSLSRIPIPYFTVNLSSRQVVPPSAR